MFDLSGLADGLGISYGATIVLLLAAVGTLYYIYRNIKNPKTKTRFMTISVLSIVIIFALSGAFLSAEDKGLVITEEDLDAVGRTAWQDDYAFYAQDLATYDSDTANTDYYDIDNDVIMAAANKIAKESDSAKEAVSKTLEFVYQTVQYNINEPDTPCLESTAPDILASGTGQCDTQSIAVIAILRKMGIAARPVGGCIYVNDKCRLQAFFQSIQAFRTPKYKIPEIVSSEDIEFSRTVSGSRKGGLHAYVVAWLPEDGGWRALEPTAGKFADTICYDYHVELFPNNNQREDICVSKSYSYAKACQLNNLNELNDFGLGLVTEVSP
jgi:transglutaminase-like putative cysteine protease